MTQAQHTPGPWKAGNVDNIGHGFLVWSTGENDGDGRDVATVKLERDRHLIAAAPAMLAALERVADLAKPGQTLTLSDAIDALCDCWNEASAAIAAATGTPTDEGGHPIPAAQQGDG